jgi:PDZ domain-containing protein/aspartyl protease
VKTARRVLVAVIWLGACGPGLAPAHLLPVASVPFDAYGGAIYVPAVVNTDSALLMFDTGLSRTGLDRDWAHAIGADSGVSDSASTTVLHRLQLGDLELPDFRAALYPLQGLSEASGRPQRGLVGHDVLQRFVVEIDYRARRVRLYDPARYRYVGHGTVVPFTPDADRPLLRARIKVRGRHPIPARLLLDTGASGLCLILTEPFVAQHGLTEISPAIEAPIGTGLVGELHGSIVRLQELRLGGLSIRSPTTGLGSESKGFLGRTDIDGVIGNAVFENTRLIVDYARRRVILEPPPDPGTPCDYDRSGLRLIARGPGLKQLLVDYVVPRSPGADAGIRVGDELLLIDGQRAADEGLSDVRQALRVGEGLRHLVLMRDADTVRVTLQLRRLL